MRYWLMGAGCLFAALLAPAARAELRAIVPVAGSTAGLYGSHFRTALQIHNRNDVAMSGHLVFRPVSGDAVTLPYSLAPREVRSWSDVVAEAGIEGLASIDLIVLEGGVPTLVVRAYDTRAADGGTTGATIPPLDPELAVDAGERASLLVPADLEHFRMNVGLRSLGDGAQILARIVDAAGVVRTDPIAISLAPNQLVQKPAAALLGTALAPNESIELEVIQGSAIVYGTVTDNRTNDPSMQLVRSE